MGSIGELPSLGNGMFYMNSRVRSADITDGLSHTLAVGERASLFCQAPWAGCVSRTVIQTSPNAPVFLTLMEEAPVMALARVGYHQFNDPYSVPYDFFSPHRTVVNFAFADGSARKISVDTSLPVLSALGSIRGSESVTLDE
jgi:prepilin-type processing-associated H-X9-DG protein